MLFLVKKVLSFNNLAISHFFSYKHKNIHVIIAYAGAPTKEIYFLAIIDVLTHYGVRKQAAKAAKTVKYGANVDGISTCDPEQYGKRFIEFMSKAIE